MKIILSIVATVSMMLSSLNLAVAQSAFQKLIGGANSEGANSIIQTEDGGYTVTGSTFSFGVGAEDIYMLHTNESGELLWSKTFGGNGNDIAHAVIQDSHGKYIIAGTTYSFGASRYRCYLLSTDSTGNHLWSNTYSGGDHSQFNSAQNTQDGGYVAAGNLAGDAFLVKVDSTGKTLWRKVYGGAGDDLFKYVLSTRDSGFILTGYTNSFGAGSDDMYVIKTDKAGDTLWTRTYGGTSYDYGTSIIESADGGYFLLGETSSFGNSSEYCLSKLSALGDIVWSKTFGGIVGDSPAAMCEARNGSILLSGQTRSFGSGYGNVLIVSADTAGNVLWSKTYGNTLRNYGNDIIATTDGGFVAAGERSTASGVGLGQSDVYLIKADSNGISGCEDSSRSLFSKVANSSMSYTKTIVSTAGIETNPATVSDAGGTGQTICFTSGLRRQKQTIHMSVYPVPVSSGFNIQTSTLQKLEAIRVYDVNGKLVMNWSNIKDKSQMYSVENLANGMYFLQIQLEGNKILSEKIAVVK